MNRLFKKYHHHTLKSYLDNILLRPKNFRIFTKPITTAHKTNTLRDVKAYDSCILNKKRTIYLQLNLTFLYRQVLLYIILVIKHSHETKE
jgi:hypothetical protein